MRVNHYVTETLPPWLNWGNEVLSYFDWSWNNLQKKTEVEWDFFFLSSNKVYSVFSSFLFSLLSFSVGFLCPFFFFFILDLLLLLHFLSSSFSSFSFSFLLFFCLSHSYSPLSFFLSFFLSSIFDFLFSVN